MICIRGVVALRDWVTYEYWSSPYPLNVGSSNGTHVYLAHRTGLQVVVF